MKPLNDQMPTFFVIGASKCGTTSLHHYLDQHPEISMSRVKEPRFFCRHLDWFPHPVISDRREYLNLFEEGVKIRGESSPQYSRFPSFPGVPEAIHAEAPRARFIYVVRDPIERVRSQYVQWTTTTYRGPDRYLPSRARYDDATFAYDLNHPFSEDNPLLNAGLYMTQVRRFVGLFPDSSILVVDGDELRDQRLRTLGEIFSFLGVDPDFQSVGFSTERNTATEKRRLSEGYRKLARNPILRGPLTALPKQVRSSAIGGVRRSMSSPVHKPSVDQELRRRLEDFYRPEVERLREFSGKDFPGWSV